MRSAKASDSLLDRYGDQLGRIVQRNRAEMALLAAKQEAERAAVRARDAMIEAQTADRAKTQFLANMSHELRTPLNAIIGFADVLRGDLAGPGRTDGAADYAEYIYGSGCHLLSIINDILDLSRLESGRLPLNEERICLPELVKACLAVLAERVDEAGLTMETALADDLPEVVGDARMLKQLVVHLVGNAIKFTPRGGRIRLRADREAEGDLTMTISDTGIGIEPEHLAQVTAPFWQVDGDLNRSCDGTGLGLPLSKALAEAHGGGLTIVSELGVGTRVAVRLPAVRCRAAAPAARTDAPPSEPAAR
jgi:signal transduction histidine kinase